MSHRQKGEHKSRHRTHAIKPQSQIQPKMALLTLQTDPDAGTAAPADTPIKAADLPTP